MNWYKYLFFKYYLFAEAIGNKGFFPEVNAWFLATIMPWFNLMTILLVLKNKDILPLNIYSYIVYSSFIVGAVLFIKFVLRNEYKLILKKYEGSDVKKGNIIVVIYSLLTVGLYFWVSSL